MSNQCLDNRRVNCRLTAKLICLHEQGYEFDFFMGKNDVLGCHQDSAPFHKDELEVRVIDQVFDHLTHSYKYIHTVETSRGVKGLLVAEGIYGCLAGPLAAVWDLPFYSLSA